MLRAGFVFNVLGERRFCGAVGGESARAVELLMLIMLSFV